MPRSAVSRRIALGILIASAWAGPGVGDEGPTYTLEWPEHRFTPQGGCQIAYNVLGPPPHDPKQNHVYYCFYAEVKSDGPLDRLRLVDESGEPWGGGRGRALKYEEPGLVRITNEVSEKYLDRLRAESGKEELSLFIFVVVLNEERTCPERILPGLRVSATCMKESGNRYLCRIVDRSVPPPEGALESWAFGRRPRKELPPGLTAPPPPPDTWNDD